MSDQPEPVDLNTASLDDMAKIPGIGSEIASRIESNRPYQSVEELTNVPGIGKAALEKLRPYFFLSGTGDGQTPSKSDDQPQTQADDTPLDSQAVEADVIVLPVPDQIEQLEPEEPAVIEEQSEVEMEEEQEPSGEMEESEILLANEEAVVAEQEAPTKTDESETTKTEKESEPTVVIPESQPVARQEPRYASRSDAFWISFGSSFLAFILAIGLTLGALALINNGLRFVSPAQLGSVSRQVDGLSSQVSILQQDLDGLRTRVDNLEGLSGRVSTVEQAAKQLRGDLDAASTQVEQLDQNVSSLQTDVTELKSVSGRFQNFLDGLRELLNNEQQ